MEQEIVQPQGVTKESMQELVSAKAEELRMKLNHQVIPLLTNLNNEWIVGYARYPSRYEKAIVFGKIAKSMLLAGLDLMDYCLLKDYSDARLYSEDQKYDGIINSAAFKLIATIDIATDECK